MIATTAACNTQNRSQAYLKSDASLPWSCKTWLCIFSKHAARTLNTRCRDPRKRFARPRRYALGILEKSARTPVGDYRNTRRYPPNMLWSTLWKNSRKPPEPLLVIKIRMKKCKNLPEGQKNQYISILRRKPSQTFCEYSSRPQVGV